MTSIGDYAFYYSGLTSVTIGNSVTSIGNYAFYYCSGLTSITIPNSVKSIGEKAFQGCSKLTSATIGDSVEKIGAYAFSGCKGITSITIPSSVTEIDDYAFNGCTGLTTVTLLGQTPPDCGLDVFKGVDLSKCVLSVPNDAIDDYKAEYGWKNFNNVTAGISNPALQYNIANKLYNLNGQRVSADAKGIVVKNGKKVFVK